MAYKFEKNPETGNQELVVSGWEDGIAASPFEGITSIKNLNIRYLPGAVYSNYKRILNTAAVTVALPKYWTQDPKSGKYFIVDSGGKVWTTTDPSSVAWTELTGNSAHYGGGQGLCVYKGYLFVFKSTAIDYYNISGGSWVFDWKTGLPNTEHMALWGQDDILYFCNGATPSTAGSSIGSISSRSSVLAVSLDTPPIIGDTAGTLLSSWSGASGNYEVTFSSGEIRLATFTSSSTAVTWYPPLTEAATADINVDFPNTFDPADATKYVYNTTALLLPGFETTATWLSELGVDLIIAAGKRLYPWDRTSVSFNAIPAFIKEDITRVTNIMNKLYITAGVKGNIYISNGYSISPWVKIPDSFFGVIDPGILFGDMMSHRNKLYVGVSLFQSPYTNGVFSIDLDTRVINFENQNSYGINASGATAPYGQPNVLIDLEAAAYDNYASAWYNGVSGGMDTNTTTVYTGGETIIESDLMNIGTFLYPKSHMNVEFKLDQPMSTSDSITIYGRQSFSGSYVQLGQTTSQAVLSDVYTPIALQKSQWLQLKVVLTSGGSTSFIRLRELRVR